MRETPQIFQGIILEAAGVLQRGGVVAFPTETVYGLGASVFDAAAIEKIFRVKGRPQDNPLIVHISSLEQLPLIVEQPPEMFYKLAEVFFPGPLTVVLRKHGNVPASVSAGLPTIGVRMPAHGVALALIEAAGVPLVAPSANLSGKPSSTCAQHVRDDFGDAIDGVIDGGECHYGLESTVIVLEPTPLILRPGAISQEQLESVLCCAVPYAEGHVEKPQSPGMKYRHYAPKAKLTLVYTHEAYLARLAEANPAHLYLDSLNPETLYSMLRDADAKGMQEIILLCTSAMQQNAALMNRLLRASNQLRYSEPTLS